MRPAMAACCSAPEIAPLGMPTTNAKGYFIGGNYGIDKNIYASARWLSASEVYGQPFEVDVMQLELNTRF